jgi:hypothetical protein
MSEVVALTNGLGTKCTVALDTPELFRQAAGLWALLFRKGAEAVRGGMRSNALRPPPLEGASQRGRRAERRRHWSFSRGIKAEGCILWLVQLELLLHAEGAEHDEEQTAKWGWVSDRLRGDVKEWLLRLVRVMLICETFVIQLEVRLRRDN